MKVKNEKKAGILLSYLNVGVGMIVSLAYTPVMLRLLGQNDYGVYQAASSIISYLSLFTLGFSSAYMRFYARYKTKEDNEGISRLNSLFLLVFGIAAVMAFVSGLILSMKPQVIFGNKFTSEELNTSRILMILMSFNMAVTFIDSVFAMYVNALEKFTFQRILSLLSTVLRPTITLPLLIMGYGSVGLTVASTTVTLGVAITDYYCAHKNKMKFSMGKPDIKLLKEIAVFSFFIFLTSLAGTMNSTIDRLLLSRYEGAGAVAVYEIGEKFNLYLMQFSIMISAVFVPQINMMVAKKRENKELTDLMIRIGRIQFILLAYVLGGFILVGKYFIGVYAGEGYDESFRIAVMIMCASFIPYIQNIGIEIQKALNKHVFRSVIYFLIAIVNVLCSILFIRMFGISGAAIGTALSLLIGNVIIMNMYYHRGIHLEMSRFWKSMINLILASLAALLPCIVWCTFRPVSTIIDFVIIGIIFTIIYIVVMWRIGMNEDEKNMARNFLIKRTRR